MISSSLLRLKVCDTSGAHDPLVAPLKCLWLQQLMALLSHCEKASNRCFDNSPTKKKALFVFKGPLHLVDGA